MQFGVSTSMRRDSWRLDGSCTIWFFARRSPDVSVLGGTIAIVGKQLVGMGYFVSSSPANSFFYLITAVHGCHLIGGLVAWVRVALRMQSNVDAADLVLSFRLCAVYWHFLLLVWVGMLALFLTT